MEIKDLFELIGFNGEPDKATPDEIKTHIGKTYVSREHAHEDEKIFSSITGKLLGPLERQVKKSFQSVGVEFDSEEIKGKKLEEILDLGAQKVGASITKLKEDAGKNNDKKYQDLEASFNQLKGDADKYKQTAADHHTTIEKMKQEHDVQLNDFKLGIVKQSALAEVPFVSDLTPLHKEGFESIISKNYKFEFDDKGEVRARDSKGEIVMDKSGAKYKPLKDIFMEVASENKLLKVNNGGQAKTPPQNNNGGQQNQADSGRKVFTGAFRNG